MLNSVVLPAPLGPISDTIACSGMSSVTSSTATSPPNSLVTRSASITAGVLGASVVALIAALQRSRRRPLLLDQLGVLGRDLAGELEPASALREQALRAQHHHQHQ